MCLSLDLISDPCTWERGPFAKHSIDYLVRTPGEGGGGEGRVASVAWFTALVETFVSSSRPHFTHGLSWYEYEDDRTIRNHRQCLRNRH